MNESDDVSVWHNPAYVHLLPQSTQMALPGTPDAPQPAVTTKGIRHELADFFRLGKPFDGDLAHTPIVALVEQPDGSVQARCIRRPAQLLELADSTVCIQSWPGQKRSDLFTYTVAEARAHLEHSDA